MTKKTQKKKHFNLWTCHFNSDAFYIVYFQSIEKIILSFQITLQLQISFYLLVIVSLWLQKCNENLIFHSNKTKQLTSGFVIFVEFPDIATMSLAFLAFSLNDKKLLYFLFIFFQSSFHLALKGLVLTATLTFSSSAILSLLKLLQQSQNHLPVAPSLECLKVFTERIIQLLIPVPIILEERIKSLSHKYQVRTRHGFQ